MENEPAFRTELEARWAEFFRCLNIKATYLPEDKSKEYTPDFSLALRSDKLLFAEVGEDVWSISDEAGFAEVIRDYAVVHDTSVILLPGPPAARPYRVILPSDSWLDEDGIFNQTMKIAFFQQDEDDEQIQFADEYWLRQIDFEEATQNPYWVYHTDDRSIKKSFGQGLLDAVLAARRMTWKPY